MAEPVVRELGTFEGYDLWAPHYDGQDNPMVAMDAAVMPGLLGDLGDLDVLDLGCGTGRYVAFALAAGARVVGLDGSPGMLAEARHLVGEGADLRRHDLAAALPFSEGHFDCVLSALVLEHIEDIAGLFAEAARVTRPGGRLVFSTMHPALFLRGQQAHYDDRDSGVTYRFRSYDHWPADFVMAGLAAGLSLEVLHEARVDAAFIAAHPRVEKYRGWPFLLALAFRKPPN